MLELAGALTAVKRARGRLLGSGIEGASEGAAPILARKPPGCCVATVKRR